MLYRNFPLAFLLTVYTTVRIVEKKKIFEFSMLYLQNSCIFEAPLVPNHDELWYVKLCGIQVGIKHIKLDI